MIVINNMRDPYLEIDWRRCHLDLMKLQDRLTTASIKNEHNEIYKLQDQITRSFAARALAVRKVVSNRGKNTPGIDGIRWKTSKEKYKAIHSLKDLSSYKAQPVKRVYIPKPGKKDLRPLGIPTYYDRAVQALWLFALDPVLEAKSDPRSYGFRKARSAHDAATYLHLVLGSKHGKRLVWEADIEKFFDKVNHQWLIGNVPMNKRILSEFLKAGRIERNQFEPSVEGFPQGGIISPLLANWALNGLEDSIKEMKGSFLCRYADDFVVVGNDLEELKMCETKVRDFLYTRGLQVSETKSGYSSIDIGFDFLGFRFKEIPDPNRVKGMKQGVFLIKPTPDNVNRIQKRIKMLVNSNRKASSGRLIQLLNPVVRGWAEYFRTVSSSRAFRRISKYCFDTLLRWARRKHRTIGSRKLAKRYWKSTKIGNRHIRWVFFGKNDRNDDITLFDIGRQTTLRHRMIPLKPPIPNPYLITDADYFENRGKRQHSQSALLDFRKKRLMSKQYGLCWSCKCPMDPKQVLEIHHIIPKSVGGTNAMKNLAVLHRECHRQITQLTSNKKAAAKVVIL
jgi:RNA-directed DNA polymerase